MQDLYLATYCYGPLQLSPLEMAQTAAALGFQGLEYLTPLTVETADAIARTGMRVIDSTESPTPDGSVKNADFLHSLGVQYICGTNLCAFGNRQQALWAAERLEKAGKKVAEQGFKLYYHNHTHEWRTEQGEYLLETLLKHTDPAHVCLQLDAGWAACAGVDLAAFLKAYPGRVELMHVKASTGVLGPEGVPFMAPPADGDGSFHLTPPGDGPEAGPPPMPSPEMEAAMKRIRAVSGPMAQSIVDYSSVMPLARDLGCKAFILERDEQYLEDPIACIREDAEILRTFW